MQLVEQVNRAAARRLAPGYDQGGTGARVRAGRAAGWLTVAATLVLFAARLALGIATDSVAVIGNAFHLLSHLSAGAVLLFTYWLAAKPATAQTPFGHGRMEHVAPLVMALLLTVAGLQLGKQSVHQALSPHPVFYWPGLPWMLLATVAVKLWAGQVVRHLGRAVSSRAVAAAARHEHIEAGLSLAVIAGVVAGHHLQMPRLDGVLGLAAAAWLVYAGLGHGWHALVPLLGAPPDRRVLQRIREVARSVEGVHDVHEIIVHDYGTKYLISLHVEVPAGMGAPRIHQVVEQCETALRREFGGEVVGHADPLAEKTEAVREMERRFAELVEGLEWVESFHGFRLVSYSEDRYVLVADVNLAESVPESRFEARQKELEAKAAELSTKVAYATLSITPKFSY
jgi:cation diffusion facilitator family transporter